MKKIHNKNSKSNKTKIELKIKLKNVANNFILTPRAVSPKSQRELNKNERIVEDIKTDRQKNQDVMLLKDPKQTKKQQYRVFNTDFTKMHFKKKFSQDETGIQTPLPRKISTVTEGFIKKKSYNSLIHIESTKLKKRNTEKPVKSQSGELKKTTLQRVIGIIIKDFKEGKLRQNELQQTLLELYDRRQKGKLSAKKIKKKDQGYTTLSNEFLRSTNHNPKAKQKTKKFQYQQEITQKVLERQGFVNKIIVKGITTSMFLKDEFNLSYIKQNERNSKRQPSFNIHTSKSIKEINEEMRLIQQNYVNLDQNDTKSLEDRMAIKIQRAWRRYRTKKLLKSISRHGQNYNQLHILQDFTDEEFNQEEMEQKENCKNLGSSKEDIAAAQYHHLVNIISESLQTKNLSKEQCLKNILHYLKFPLDAIPKLEPINIEEDIEQKEIQSIMDNIQNQNSDEIEVQLEQCRVKMLDSKQKQKIIQNQEIKSQDEQANSFTNKYSSKQVQNYEYFKDNGQGSELDKSLTFAHSQTLAAQSFKTINIQNIEEGLQSREEAILLRKQKQIQQLTELFFNNKINKDEYQQQKNKIDKWFKAQQKELKKVKNSLLKSCNQARKILQNDLVVLKNQKSKKMMKCLSDKYIKNKDWMTNLSITSKKSNEKRLNCQQSEKQTKRKTRQNETQLKQEFNDQKSSDQNYALLQKNREEQENQANTNNQLRFQISPKLRRNKSLEQSQKIKQYKYEQIQGVIQEQFDGLEQGINKFEQKVQLSSDKLITNDQLDSIQEHQLILVNNLVNDERKRFKYLCTEDKEDIFQFLFLDLVLEMFTQSFHGQSRILRSAETYINKANKLKKIPKGIKTNIASSKQYLRVLSQYVLKNSGALKNLSSPMGPSAIEMLKYMRDQIAQADDEESISSTLVIPLEIFQKVSKLPQLQLKLQRYYDNEQNQQGRISFLKAALNINNKSLFDSLNQVLDHERPYGVWGKPFPWKKMLSIDRRWSEEQQRQKMKKSVDRTIEACSYLCGIIVDKEDSLFGSHRVSQEYIQHIRQDRLSKMLANDLIQNEERWIFYDDEQTQILMDVSSFITKRLIKEVVLEIISIRMRF